MGQGLFLIFFDFFWRGGEFCCFLAVGAIFARAFSSPFSYGLFGIQSARQMERDYSEGFSSFFFEEWFGRIAVCLFYFRENGWLSWVFKPAETA